MNISDAQKIFESGGFQSALIVRIAPDVHSLYLENLKGDQSALVRARGGIAIYNTLDAAFSAAYRIGFTTVTVRAGLDYAEIHQAVGS